MHDIRPNGVPEPRPQQPRQFPDVNLHPDYAGHVPAAAPQPAPAPAPAPQPAPEPPPAPTPREDEHVHHSLAHSLRTIKFGLLTLTGILAIGTFLFLWQGGNRPATSNRPASSGSSSTQNSQNSGQGATNAPSGASASNQSHPVSCLGQTGTDASTDAKTFTDIEGTQCTYRSSSTPETLVLNGKLTGRNTEGTGMSVTINVNGKVCNGGESLNYARTYTPMTSNCVFDVPANSSVAIKWQFLSPFGGSASVLRSSKNIAPSITGVAIPKLE